jgi:V/A-type H+-transporting ATPase subunit F
MKFYLISDNIDTQKGMRLAGIEGVVVHEYDDTLQALESCLSDESIGIILITEKLAALMPEKINNLKINETKPLVVVIPDRHGTKREPDSITRYVRDAIGVKI